MTQIFISHSSRDGQRCEWLKASAEEMGIAAYLAEHDVRPGTYLAEKVKQAIDDSDAVVVLISDNSVNAPYVHQEIGYAMKAGRLIIPLIQPGVATDDLAMLQGIEYIPFDFDAPYDGHTALRTALQRLVEQQREQAATAQRDVAVLLVLACLALFFVARES